jgi:hypothetical protein
MKRLYPLVIIFLLVCLLWAKRTNEPNTETLELGCDVVCGEHTHIMNEQLERCYCYSALEYREYIRKK